MKNKQLLRQFGSLQHKYNASKILMAILTFLNRVDLTEAMPMMPPEPDCIEVGYPYQVDLKRTSGWLVWGNDVRYESTWAFSTFNFSIGQTIDCLTSWVNLSFGYNTHYYSIEDINNLILPEISASLRDLLKPNISYISSNASVYIPAVNGTCINGVMQYDSDSLPTIASFSSGNLYRNCADIYLNLAGSCQYALTNITNASDELTNLFQNAIDPYCTDNFYDDWKVGYKLIFVLGMVLAGFLAIIGIGTTVSCARQRFFSDRSNTAHGDNEEQELNLLEAEAESGNSLGA